MKERLHPKKINDQVEKTWALNADILDHHGSNDRDLMSKGAVTSFNQWESIPNNGKSIFSCKAILEEGCETIFLDWGYSPYFNDIMKEACSRGYDYVSFDRKPRS